MLLTVMHRVAGILRSFHQTEPPDLPELTDQGIAERFDRAAADLAAARPEMGDAVRRLGAEAKARMACLPSLAASRLATLHNDFHWNQMRFNGERVALLDFERVCRGDPWIDVANFATQLVMLGHRSEVAAGAAETRAWALAFLDAWREVTGADVDRHRLTCYSVLAALELARGMLRHLRPGWPGLAARAVEFGERQLTSNPDGLGDS
ncbi:MAG: phosphotransferase [bacterium]|nr:phosphotransferase [bacterium]